MAQPDGTYLWLQSFINHYSFATWLQKKDTAKETGLAGHLTYDELLNKLDDIDRLMNIDRWDADANDLYYLDLFGVDMFKIYFRAPKSGNGNILIVSIPFCGMRNVSIHCQVDVSVPWN